MKFLPPAAWDGHDSSRIIKTEQLRIVESESTFKVGNGLINQRNFILLIDYRLPLINTIKNLH